MAFPSSSPPTASPVSVQATAHHDLCRGFLGWRLWLGLGLQDIRIRYRRTLLGPWWITASQTVVFICMGMLFSAVLKNDVRVYLPYLAAGLVTWSYLSASANDGPFVFVGAQSIITSLRIPLVVHVLRANTRNFVIFLHNFCAALAAFLVLGGEITAASLMLVVTLPLMFVTVSSATLILGIVGSRFRDLGPVIGITTQLVFFMTPIIWRPEDIPDASMWWVQVNPVFHLIETVRAPMLGRMPDMLSLGVAGATMVAVTLLAYALFRGFRHRIAYWI